MGRFTINGEAKKGVDSEEFHDAMVEAGPVECWKCKVKIGQGNRGMSICVCGGSCMGYYCNDHIERHDKCEEGR